MPAPSCCADAFPPPRGAVGTESFPDVYRLDLSRLHHPGRYRVTVNGAQVAARSPWFRVLGPGHLFGTLLRHGVSFDQQPARRSRRHPRPAAPPPLPPARPPRHRLPLAAHGARLRPDHRPRPASVGRPGRRRRWLVRRRRLPEVHPLHGVQRRPAVHERPSARPPGTAGADRRGALRAALARRRCGTAGTRPSTSRWGSARATGPARSAATTTSGACPQADDRDTAHLDRFVSHRPVFAAAPAGHRISPNLVGRVVAAFALAAQADASHHRSRALHELRQARLLYARAATRHPPQPLVTALPHAFYPESSWLDDMQLGAAEIALAAHRLGAPAGRYLARLRALRPALPRLRTPPTPSTSTTPARSPTSSLADGDGAGPPHGRSPSPATTSSRDLRSQILRGVRHARHDSFGAAASVDEFDVNSHTFGLIATVGAVRRPHPQPTATSASPASSAPGCSAATPGA